jgi:hypothetical protein
VGLDGDGGLNFARSIALRVTVALGSSITRVCVQTDVDERHLLEHECEGIKRGGEGAIKRVVPLIVIKRWGVIGTSFRRHVDRRVTTSSGKNR